MKRLSVLLLFASLVFCGTADAGQPFTLSGRIDGLEPGDTLRFERILLPEWDREFAFDVVVEMVHSLLSCNLPLPPRPHHFRPPHFRPSNMSSY